MRMRLIRRGCLSLLSTVAVVCGAPLVSPLSSAAAAHDEAQPTWSVDLSESHGYEDYLRASLVIPAEVAFISKDRLVVSFLHRCSEASVEPSPRLKKREEGKTPCALTLTVLLLDTKSGQVERTLTFPFHTVHQSQPSSPPGQGLRLLMTTRGGEFVIHTGDFLLRYGSNLEFIEKRPIGNPDRTVVFVSPGGTLVLLSEYEDVAKFRKSIFPSDNIQAGRLFGVGWPGEGVTDDGKVLSFVEDWQMSNPKSPDFRRVTSGIKNCLSVRGLGFCLALCEAEDRCAVLGGYGWLVDDNHFVMKNSPKRFVLVDRTGKVLHRGSADSPISGFVAGGAAAQKLVVKSGRMWIRHGAMDWKFVAEVLDLPDMAPALKVTFGGKRATKLRSPDVAISPDGSQIAILVGSEVKLYQVPGRAP